MLKVPQEDREVLRNLLRDYDNGIGNKLESAEAMRRINQGLIEICETSYFGGLELEFARSHSSSGLLLTQNGYFVTCFHCIKKGFKNLIIVDNDGNSYPIEGVCAYSKDKDIAIVKAKMNISRGHIIYRYNSLNNLEILAVNLTRREGKIISRGTRLVGLARVLSINTVELFSKTISKPGDSGGIIIDIYGGIISIILGTAFNNPPKDANEVTRSVLFLSIIDLLRQVCK